MHGILCRCSIFTSTIFHYPQHVQVKTLAPFLYTPWIAQDMQEMMYYAHQGVSTCTPYVCCKMRLYQNVTLAQPLEISKVEIQRYFSDAVSVGNNVH